MTTLTELISIMSAREDAALAQDGKRTRGDRARAALHDVEMTDDELRQFFQLTTLACSMKADNALELVANAFIIGVEAGRELEIRAAQEAT